MLIFGKQHDGCTCIYEDENGLPRTRYCTVPCAAQRVSRPKRKKPEYLGETILEQGMTKFANHTTNDWIRYWIDGYGSTDGAHHKQWLIDQIAKLTFGTPVIIKLAKWDNGQEEYRITLGKTNDEYNKWFKEFEEQYGYEHGTPP